MCYVVTVDDGILGKAVPMKPEYSRMSGGLKMESWTYRDKLSAVSRMMEGRKLDRNANVNDENAEPQF